MIERIIVDFGRETAAFLNAEDVAYGLKGRTYKIMAASRARLLTSLIQLCIVQSVPGSLIADRNHCPVCGDGSHLTDWARDYEAWRIEDNRQLGKAVARLAPQVKAVAQSLETMLAYVDRQKEETGW